MVLREALTYSLENWEELRELILEHIYWVFVTVLLATAIAVPLGIIATRYKRIEPAILTIGEFGMATPNIALLFLVYVGLMAIYLKYGALAFLGFNTVLLIALVTYALLPIMQNTITGIEGIEPAIKEAARGMGMSDSQVLLKVELPLALYPIMGGIRTSLVITVGAVALAAYMGLGGLGEWIFRGIFRPVLVHATLAAAIIAALIAIALEQVMEKVEERLIPRST